MLQKQVGKISAYYVFALLVLILGGINNGLIGLLDVDLIAKFLGYKAIGAKLVYSLIGIAGLTVGIDWIIRIKKLTDNDKRNTKARWKVGKSS